MGETRFVRAVSKDLEELEIMCDTLATEAQCHLYQNFSLFIRNFYAMHKNAVGTIDVESDKPHAFGPAVQPVVAACSDVIAPLWQALSACSWLGCFSPRVMPSSLDRRIQ